jgi:hypothetical protein
MYRMTKRYGKPKADAGAKGKASSNLRQTL